MSDKTVAQKLMIKEGRKVLFVNAPPGYGSLLGPLPRGAVVLNNGQGPADILQLFVRDRKELEKHLPQARDRVSPAGMIWVTYYKGTSKRGTDINRESINAYAKSLGMTGVAMISVNEDWSALRLKFQGR